MHNVLPGETREFSIPIPTSDAESPTDAETLPHAEAPTDTKALPDDEMPSRLRIVSDKLLPGTEILLGRGR